MTENSKNNTRLQNNTYSPMWERVISNRRLINTVELSKRVGVSLAYIYYVFNDTRPDTCGIIETANAMLDEIKNNLSA